STTAVVQGAGAPAGVLSIADIATTGNGNFLTAYPTGSTAPLAANVNYTPGDTYNIVENSAYGTTGTGSSVSVLNGPSNAANANVVVDESGYFAPPGAAAPYTVTANSSANPTVGPASAVTYTASGLPTTAGSTVNIALFPATGATAPAGGLFEAGVAGPAPGQGTTNT